MPPEADSSSCFDEASLGRMNEKLYFYYLAAFYVVARVDKAAFLA